MSASCSHNHSHDHGAPTDGKFRRVLWIALIVNAAMFVVELATAQTASSAALLADLLRIYRTGLTQPLHFFPKASLAYVEGGGDLLAAAGAFRPYGDAAAWSESHDPAVRLALRGIDDPLDGQFETLARAVFEPLRAHDVTAGGST